MCHMCTAKLTYKFSCLSNSTDGRDEVVTNRSLSSKLCLLTPVLLSQDLGVQVVPLSGILQVIDEANLSLSQ